MIAQLQQYLTEATAFAHTLVEKEEASRPNLRGACAIASAWLFRRLKQEGLDAEVVLSHAHCYVRVNGLLMDPTATQFDMEPFVSEGLPESCVCPWEYEEYATARDLDELMRVMDNSGWSWDADRIYLYVLKGEAA